MVNDFTHFLKRPTVTNRSPMRSIDRPSPALVRAPGIPLALWPLRGAFSQDRFRQSELAFAKPPFARSAARIFGGAISRPL